MYQRDVGCIQMNKVIIIRKPEEKKKVAKNKQEEIMVKTSKIYRQI